MRIKAKNKSETAQVSKGEQFSLSDDSLAMIYKCEVVEEEVRGSRKDVYTLIDLSVIYQRKAVTHICTLTLANKEAGGGMEQTEQTLRT